MEISDIAFYERLRSALIKAAELDYMRDIPHETELTVTLRPSRKMRAMLRNPMGYARRMRRSAYQRTLRMAATILLAITVAFGATMAIPQTRAIIINFVRSWFDDNTEYQSTASSSSPILAGWTFEYVPTGYSLVKEVFQKQLVSFWYSDGMGNDIQISIFALTTGKITIDNEHSVFRKTKINGYICDIYENKLDDYPNHIVLYAEDKNVAIRITSVLDVSELIKIAENAK